MCFSQVHVWPQGSCNQATSLWSHQWRHGCDIEDDATPNTTSRSVTCLKNTYLWLGCCRPTAHCPEKSCTGHLVWYKATLSVKYTRGLHLHGWTLRNQWHFPREKIIIPHQFRKNMIVCLGSTYTQPTWVWKKEKTELEAFYSCITKSIEAAVEASGLCPEQCDAKPREPWWSQAIPTRLWHVVGIDTSPRTRDYRLQQVFELNQLSFPNSRSSRDWGQW